MEMNLFPDVLLDYPEGLELLKEWGHFVPDLLEDGALGRHSPVEGLLAELHSNRFSLKRGYR